MKILRVENKNGDGPYRKGFFTMWESATSEITLNPDPLSDPYLTKFLSDNQIPLSSCLFGFESEAQLKSWFSESERRALASIGFFVQVIEIDDSLVGKGLNQVIFINQEVKRIKV